MKTLIPAKELAEISSNVDSIIEQQFKMLNSWLLSEAKNGKYKTSYYCGDVELYITNELQACLRNNGYESQVGLRHIHIYWGGYRDV